MLIHKQHMLIHKQHMLHTNNIYCVHKQHIVFLYKHVFEKTIRTLSVYTQTLFAYTQTTYVDTQTTYVTHKQHILYAQTTYTVSI